ncbi:MAG: sugar ABC transporter permease [Exilispira sp.]|nr:sugar ABC transporter permease [Exilispira sp.]
MNDKKTLFKNSNNKLKDILLFLSPMIIYLFFWRLFPLIYTFYLSFTDYNLSRMAPPSFTGLNNYIRLLSDGRFHHSLYISFLFMLVSTIMTLLIGVLMALVTDLETRWKSFVQGVILIPMMITPVVVGTIWRILYEPSVGPINYFINMFVGFSINWLGSTETALWGVIITEIWEWAPFIYILVLSSLQGIPKPLYEAAEIDGASSLQIIKFITLPIIQKTVLVSALLRGLDAFRVFPTIYVMTGGGPGRATESVSIFIYKTAFRFFNMGYSSSMVIVVLLLLISVYATYLKTTFKEKL